MVGASLDIMDKDTKRMRGDKPYLFTNLKDGENVDAVIDFIIDKGMLKQS
jgi:urease accessory protein